MFENTYNIAKCRLNKRPTNNNNVCDLLCENRPLISAHLVFREIATILKH